jgi:hypothetical protein
MQTLLTSAEAAEYLRVSVRTLQRWRLDGVGPTPIEVSPPTATRPQWRYLLADLDAWVRGGRVEHAKRP